MKKLLMTVAVIASLGAPAYAATGCDDIAVPGMSESVIIELKQKCVALAKPTTSVSVDSMGEYAELGKKYGIALSEVAKSIGTTVNELAQTPVGKFMLIMVAYKVMGDGLIGVLGGAIWFLTMIPLWVYMFHRMVLSTRSVRETYDPTTAKLSKREINPVNWNDAPGVISVVMMFVMLFICVCGFFMIFG